jgi:glycosyltransferase involved in cell wall biosynthesis
MITYNQEAFITQAIQGVLMQQTGYTIELVIAEDGSTDRTLAICNKFAQEYPDIIKLLPSSENAGMMPNFLRALQFCSGKYIALCEGDDYWTDSYKLEKQVSFLENNSDYAICFSRAKIEYGQGIKPFIKELNAATASTTTLEDICKGNYIHTASVVFKNRVHSIIPSWYIQAYPGDWPLHIINACYGKIKFINEEMCVYRVHKGGVHSTKFKEMSIQMYLPTLLNLLNYVKDRHPDRIKPLFKTYQYHYFLAYGLRNEQKKNRLERCWIFLKTSVIVKSEKMFVLFWLPLVFGNRCTDIWYKK